MTGVSISLPAKRRRGRPRKDVNLSRQGSSLQSPQNSTHADRAARTICPTPNGLKNNTLQELNTNPKNTITTTTTTTDGMVGSTIYGVIEGSFDTGYLISVRIANNNTPFHGVVFQPKKIVPVTAANDVAPQATMYQRQEITVPFSSRFSPRPHKAAMQTVPALKQTVLRPILPLSVTPYFSNQSAFMLPDTMMLRTSAFPQLGGKTAIPGTPKVGSNQQSPPVYPTDNYEVMQAFGKESTNQKSQVHGPSTFTCHNFMEDVRRPTFDIQQGEMIRRKMEHLRQFVLELQEPRDIKTDLDMTDMYYNDLRGPDANFHHDLFTDQSQPNYYTRLGPEFRQCDIMGSLSKSPNLKLDLSSSSVHEKSRNYLIDNEMKSPNIGYHQALLAGNPLLLPPEFSSETLEFMLEKNHHQSLPNSKKTRQETSTEGVSSPSGPYKLLELTTPQSSTVNTRPGEQTNSSAGCIPDTYFVLSDVVQPTEYLEHLGDFSEAIAYR